MATLTTLLAGVRHVTDHDSDDQAGTTAQLTDRINEEYLTLHRQIADLIPDLFTVVSGDITVASGTTTINPAAAPLSISNLSKIRAVQIKVSGRYFDLPVAPVGNAEMSGRRGWRLLFGPTIELTPANATAGTYRLRYMAKAAALTGGAPDVLLPDGADKVIIERVAARIRPRVDEEQHVQAHLAAADEAWRELRKSLVAQYRPNPMGIQDLSGRYR